jgi:parvulin-like peptidyl-prolyl isomerase
MEAVVARLKQGQPFISLVDELKRSPSVIQGSDLGFYSLADLADQLRQVVNKMNPGEFSEVLKTNFGYQIIYLQNIEESQAKPLEAAEAEIEEILFKEMVDNKYQQWLEELRAKSHIRIIN